MSKIFKVAHETYEQNEFIYMYVYEYLKSNKVRYL